MKYLLTFPLLVLACHSHAQDFYNSKFSIGQNLGWYKLASFDLNINSSCCNSVNVDFVVHYVSSKEMWDIDGNIRFRQMRTSDADVAKWNYIQVNQSGDLIKFKRVSEYYYELWGNSPNWYGHYSIELAITKENNLTVTTYTLSNPASDAGQTDIAPSGDIYFPHRKVGIGTTEPDSPLTVKGIIHAEEVKVDLNVPGPDYVFDESYALRSLEATESFIVKNRHLPGIPSSAEMQQNGVNLLEMNMKLLEKVEELTLHLIRLEKQNEEQKELNQLQQEQLDALAGKSGQ